jgi:Flp pilus assembly protein TadG
MDLKGFGEVLAFWRNDRGATALEFALVAPWTLMLMLSILEIGVVAFMSASLDNAVTTAARTVRTGQTDAPMTAEAFEDSICALIPGDSADCREKLTISVERFASFTNVQAAMATAPDGDFDRGQAGDVMLVKASFRWPLLTPFMDRIYQPAGDGDVMLDTRIAFKNEPYA